VLIIYSICLQCWAFVTYKLKKKRISENSTYTFNFLECKEHVKYLGILLGSNLSWKFYIEYIALKVSKIIGAIARLRHFVPLCTLLNIYRSLSFPYLSYSLAAWGQAAKSHLQKLLVLQKRVDPSFNVFF